MTQRSFNTLFLFVFTSLIFVKQRKVKSRTFSSCVHSGTGNKPHLIQTIPSYYNTSYTLPKCIFTFSVYIYDADGINW